MPPSQDQDKVNHRPLLWIYGISIALCLTGGLIGCVGLHYVRPWTASVLTWKAGVVLMLLSTSAYHAIPSALVAIRHPWAAGHGSALSKRHPRLGGLVEAWVGLIVFGETLALGVDAFTPLSLFETREELLVTFGVGLLCVIVPLLAVILYDRHR